MTEIAPTRRGFLRGAFALAACAVVASTGVPLAEADAQRLARLLATPGAVIENETFVFDGPVVLTDIPDATLRHCRFSWKGLRDDQTALRVDGASTVAFDYCWFDTKGEEPWNLI